jgi:hypothetical protein
MCWAWPFLANLVAGEQHQMDATVHGGAGRGEKMIMLFFLVSHHQLSCGFPMFLKKKGTWWTWV